jgi:hypothetical protein
MSSSFTLMINVFFMNRQKPSTLFFRSISDE